MQADGHEKTSTVPNSRALRQPGPPEVRVRVASSGGSSCSSKARSEPHWLQRIFCFDSGFSSKGSQPSPYLREIRKVNKSYLFREYEAEIKIYLMNEIKILSYYFTNYRKLILFTVQKTSRNPNFYLIKI
jgi:hypothetical protein